MRTTSKPHRCPTGMGKAITAFIFLSILLLGLILVTSADDTETVERPYVGAYTLALHDSVHIDYAVKVPDRADSAGLLVWEREAPTAFVHDGVAKDITSDSGYIDLDGVRYRVFVYTDVSAKEFADDIYAVPYIVVDGEYVYGEPTKYGVLYYAEAKKGDESLTRLLSSMLSYGAAAQSYFDHSVDRPADGEFVRLDLDGAALADGMSYGLYAVGDALPSPSIPDGTSAIFGGWYSDANYTEKLDTVPTCSSTLYAKWVDPIINADFSNERAPSTVTYGTSNIRFNIEERATLETLRDETGAPYLNYTHGAETSIYAANSDVGTSLAAMSSTDVFSYSIILGRDETADVLTTSKLGIASHKNASGSNYFGMLNLAYVREDGSVTTYGGTSLGILTSDSTTAINVAIDFANATLTYYDKDGAVIVTENFNAPSGTNAKSTKAWQKLVSKYLFYAEFNSGDTLRFYGLMIAEGNIFA